MRWRFLIFITILLLLFGITPVSAFPSDEKENILEAIIIEVDGDPHQHAEYLETYHPFVEIISVYDEIFNGLAVKAEPKKLARLSSLEFVQAIHPERTYKTTTNNQKPEPPIETLEDFQDNEHVVLPQTLNDTNYTGRGVKVGVIDTGIDYTHPDLEKNYQGGYDLVDLDEDPMETMPEQGIPTEHGSHVAGIIGGNGSLKGVAPEADIYAYRALGPGGVGSSIHIIAAMEQAIKDDVDIINLSLGNDVNGPDYPTSVAVNKASELGVSVVIANGNSGPDTWTVGSPATATKAFSVGASEQLKHLPFLHEPIEDETIALMPFIGSPPWDLTKDYPITTDKEKVIGKIALIQRGDIPFYELAKKAENQGAVAVLIYNNEEEAIQGSIASEKDPVEIPVALISKEHGEWLANQSEQKTSYLETVYKEKEAGVAEFSSRGPVTVNWDIKPDILAPGTDILSTVPGGYQILQGTSMAAPHAAGAIALVKEARPDWSNEQIYGALKTTTKQMMDTDEKPLDPIEQGAGLIQIKKAIETSTIIYDSSLSFGEFSRTRRSTSTDLSVENKTNETQTYSFQIPTKERGIHFNLPQTFMVKPKEKKTIPIELKVNPQLLDEGIHQNWLTLESADQTYQLPYLFVNETADHPKVMGFNFSLKELSQDDYQYQLYLTEQAKTVDVNLYNPDTLVYDRQFLHLNNVDSGLNEGELQQSDLGNPGHYIAIVTVQLEDGQYESYETMLTIEP
ncbi:S8 family serine peptidase [Virgibacillus sp. MSJ-26]|uniref:S8 family serine peptidase n=1 Tax=Virgibacillus sp. MSJ-26 TaxID=2841522 RepID=UPI001C107F05|nr:S8 family serine peptidase [Virgibacillus sp. MSJ-26]MBU5465263.1 S8 family serine peptidase [Virgibacillus sp. MSJ-26]